jgi:cytidylate kinase
VAIDGPAGAGKGVVSARLADHFGYGLLETGAIYRAVALVARRRGIAAVDGGALAEAARAMPFRFERHAGTNRVLLGDEDVTAALREPAVADAASRVASLPAVRAALLDVQRRLGAAGGVVAEGRDIGTVVFPDAEVKFFLTASVAARAERRWLQLRAAGEDCTLEEVRRAQERRDEADSTRAVAPLRQAPDAIVVDSTALDVDGVVAALAEHVATARRRLGLASAAAPGPSTAAG